MLIWIDRTSFSTNPLLLKGRIVGQVGFEQKSSRNTFSGRVLETYVAHSISDQAFHIYLETLPEVAIIWRRRCIWTLGLTG